MKPRNYGAIALLTVFTFFERFAYYGFRSTVVPRLLTEGGMASTRISMIMSLSMMATILGLAIGGGLSLATRNRFLLAGGALLLVLVHGVAAAAPMLGLFVLPVVGGLLRPLVYVAAAEELDQEGRVWKAVVVASLFYGATNVGAAFSAVVGGTREASLYLSYALPVVAAVVALVPCAILAFAIPGAPFRWATHEALVSGSPQQAPYRPEPGVRRGGGGPSPWILLVVLGAMFFSNCAQTAQGDAAFAAIDEGGLARTMRWVQMLNPVIVTVMGVLLVALGAYLASTRARLSPTWFFGAGLGLQALALLVTAVAFSGHSQGLAIGGSVFDALGEGVAAPIAIGYVLGTLSSRWVGLVASGYSVLAILPNMVLSPLLARREAMIPVLVLSALFLLVAAVLTLVLGPRLHRGGDAAA
ncbi:MAG: hypothetical protein HOO96_28045 [Polyangiaceae bacterium]|nr:hypothetical protein [Polyangiaceae bacterium]